MNTAAATRELETVIASDRHPGHGKIETSLLPRRRFQLVDSLLFAAGSFTEGGCCCSGVIVETIATNVT